MMEKKRIRVAISHGDINGIGYEVMLKTFAEDAIFDLFTPVLFGSHKAFTFWSDKLSLPEIKYQLISHISEVKDGQLNLIECNPERTVELTPGVASQEAGQLAFDALETASQAVLRGECQVLVTAPINKAIMPKDLFPFNGHTKYLEAIAANVFGKSLMLLCAQDCRVALATEHIAIAQIPSMLTQELIVEKIKLLEAGLIRDFGITKPRIAVFGLNPHTGDNGLMGREEIDIIRPAIAEANKQGVITFGPYPADGFWAKSADAFDAVLAMYHDQGLAPFKAMYMNEGVNTTLGLSIIRTSPDHGTGYAIAGEGIASPDSFRSAIYLAIDIYRMRNRHDQASRNPLRRTFYSKAREDEKLDLQQEDND